MTFILDPKSFVWWILFPLEYLDDSLDHRSSSNLVSIYFANIYVSETRLILTVRIEDKVS